MQLEDDALLSDSNIPDGATLGAQMRLRGGAAAKAKVIAVGSCTARLLLPRPCESRTGGSHTRYMACSGSRGGGPQEGTKGRGVQNLAQHIRSYGHDGRHAGGAVHLRHARVLENQTNMCAIEERLHVDGEDTNRRHK